MITAPLAPESAAGAWPHASPGQLCARPDC